MNKSIWIWAALLGVVVGLLLFPVRIPKGGGHSGFAANTAYNLKSSISSYYSEYRKMPGFGSPQTYDIDLQSDEKFMDYLLGSDRGQRKGFNKQGTVFFTGKTARANDDGTYKRGVSINSDGSGALWDPWGNHYRIRIDANEDSKVADPSTNEPVNESVLIWTAGKDGKFETWRDNQKTW